MTEMTADNTSTENSAQLFSVDVLKFIMAFAVIVIHVAAVCDYWDFINPFLDWFIRLAVPFYFICSGYLLKRNCTGLSNRLAVKRIKSKSITIFRVFAYWVIIYLPISIYIYVNSDINFVKYWATYMSHIVLEGESDYAWPLWYVYSMAIVFAIISFSIERPRLFKCVTVIFFSIPLLIWIPQICEFSIGRLYGPIRILSGGTYIISGVLCYKYGYKLKSIFTVSLCLALSLMLKFYSLPYWELFGGVGFFCFARWIIPMDNGNKHFKNICYNLRKLSMWIYYLHMYPIFIILTAAHKLGYHLQMWPTFWYVAAITLILSSLLLYSASHFKRLNFLNVLLNGKNK